jgi:type IV pilus assembly protein PilO
VVVVATLALGWFLLISPKRSEAADLRAQADTQQDANARLRTKVTQLKADAKDLPAQKARLAQIDVNLPANPQLPALVRTLSQAARQSSVELVSIAPAAPAVLAAPTVARPVAAGTESADATASGDKAGSDKAGSDTASGEATGTAAPVATVVKPPAVQLASIPVVVVVDGDYFEAEQFLNKVESFKRSFLVTGLTLEEPRTGAKAGETQAPGAVRMTITGRVYMTVPGAARPLTPVTPAPAK